MHVCAYDHKLWHGILCVTSNPLQVWKRDDISTTCRIWQAHLLQERVRPRQQHQFWEAKTHALHNSLQIWNKYFGVNCGEQQGKVLSTYFWWFWLQRPSLSLGQQTVSVFHGTLFQMLLQKSIMKFHTSCLCVSATISWEAKQLHFYTTMQFHSTSLCTNPVDM